MITRFDSQKSTNFPGGFSIVCPVADFLLLVGSDINERYRSNTLYFFNENIVDSLEFESKIVNVLARNDRFIVVFENLVLVYTFPEKNLVKTIRTANNTYGACAISNSSSFVLATSFQPGYVRVDDFDKDETNQSQIHENSIVVITINNENKLGASASERGTLVRVFDIRSLNVLYELRRGNTVSHISCLEFSLNSDYVIASNSKNTIHLWDISSTSSYSHLKYLPAYFSSKTSISKLYMNPDII